MRLKNLTLRAFKGVREFTLDTTIDSTGGGNADIRAANGVGKTSIADAFSWLLFGRDSLGRADFGIIPTDADGEPIEDASPTVTAELILPDGDSITLMRRLVQKKQSVRGAAPTAAGTTTEFAVDFVPCKKSEYAKCIAALADEALFPLLTDPRAFCGALHWQKRRDMLLRLFGGASDADIIADDPELACLPAILGKRTVDDHKRALAPRIAELKKQLAAIPARIDEVKRGMPPSPNGDPAADLAELRVDRRFAAAQFERLAYGGEAAELRRQLAEVNALIVTAETAAKRAHAERLAALVAAKNEAAEAMRERHHRLAGIERHIESTEHSISSLRDKLSTNAELARAVRDRQPPDAGFDDTCPACGQDLPADQVRAAAEKALAEFNLSRSRDLETLAATDGKLRAMITSYEAALAKLHAEAEAATRAADEATEALNAASAAVDALAPADISDPRLLAEACAIRTKISAFDEDNASALADARAKLDQIDALIIQAEIAAADIRSREQAAARIAALNDERRTVAAELDAAESEMALCRLFTRRKIEQVSESINRRFGGVTWKLFDQQVNGELADCCEATVNGVPWRDLSNSQQINAGLAVIDVIGRAYDITPPIFIDNAESVSAIRPTTAQQIRLIVSAAHKTLTVEIAK